MPSEDLNSDCQNPLNAGHNSMPLFLVLGKGKVKTGSSWRMLGNQSSQNGKFQDQGDTLSPRGRQKEIKENSCLAFWLPHRAAQEGKNTGSNTHMNTYTHMITFKSKNQQCKQTQGVWESETKTKACAGCLD